MKHTKYSFYRKFVASSRIEALSKMEHLYLVILAGGEGTRLFPYSNPERPKQLCPIGGENWRANTFLKRTIANYLECGFDRKHIIIVTSSSYQTGQTRFQLSIPGGIILNNIWEIPSSYGYAGTMVEVTKRLAKIDSEAIVFNTPSDHYLDTGEEFVEAVFMAVNSAEEGNISAIGVKTKDVDTIMTCGNIVYDKHKIKDGVTVSKNFIEKPSRAHARQLAHSDTAICNTGICVWRAKDLLKYATMPSEGLTTENLMRAFNGYLRIVIGKFKWQDCGTLRGLYNALDKTEICHNVMLGDGGFNLDISCKNSLFYADKGMVLDVRDVVNCAVAFTSINHRPILVISNLDESQKIKELAEHYSEHEKILEEDFSFGARNNEVLYSNMYDSFSVGFVNVENVVVCIMRRSDSGELVAEIFKRKHD